MAEERDLRTEAQKTAGFPRIIVFMCLLNPEKKKKLRARYLSCHVKYKHAVRVWAISWRCLSHVNVKNLSPIYLAHTQVLLVLNDDFSKKR